MLARKQILCLFVLTVYFFCQTYTQVETVVEPVEPYPQVQYDPLPPSVLDYMANRRMRYHHFLWHNVRNNWNRLSNTTKQMITELGWAPPRPARSYDSGSARQIVDNDAGEDFFYMHRYMILKYNKIVEVYNEPAGPVVGWTTIPAPGDLEYPVPPGYIIPNSSTTYNRTKTDSYYNRNIAPHEAYFTNLDNLRNMTLGQLGARIESTIHSWMHLRWSSNSSYGFRPSLSVTVPDVDEIWDDPQYDWLVDSYASHVNPIFWKIHGWVDERIEDWKRANNVTTITWKGTWIGGPLDTLSFLDTKMSMMTRSDGNEDVDEMDGMNMDGEIDDRMTKMIGLLLSEVKETSFGDDIAIDDFLPSFKKPASPVEKVASLGTNLSKVKKLRKKMCKVKSKH